MANYGDSSFEQWLFVAFVLAADLRPPWQAVLNGRHMLLKKRWMKMKLMMSFCLQEMIQMCRALEEVLQTEAEVLAGRSKTSRSRAKWSLPSWKA